MPNLRALLPPIIAAAVVSVPAVAYAQTTTAPVPPPPAPPTVAQLCDAPGVGVVNAYLAAVADTDLVGALAPLADLTVPRTAGGVELEVDVDVAEVRFALGCDETATPTVTPSPTTTPAPTSTPVPTRVRVAPAPTVVVGGVSVTG